MGFDFNIRSVKDRLDLIELKSFLMGKHLNYPQYEDWVHRAMVEIDLGYKTGILAYERGTLIADLVYQPHKELPGFREIKNLRIHPRMRKRGLARFMIKQAEVEDTRDLLGIIADAHDTQKDAILFLQSEGYVPISGCSLYDPNQREIILMKLLQRQNQKLIKRIKEYFPTEEIR